jgi:hypothetical protein
MSDEGRCQLFSMVDPILRQELTAEVNILARRYAPEGDAPSLDAVATTLEASADGFVVGRDRIRLWIILLRERAHSLQVG